ncbi:hypothetical protein C8R47DRAFT_145479 [Mycena vitilis]|nr:hypothetical protein C8R47DRAFT_145479 [Mycena vitilis]
MDSKDPAHNEANERKVESNNEDEMAAAKLWAVYVSEAERYDRALVETWRSDMEGLLIFAALFSAILTAFIIESYKSLSSDPGDLTVQFLGQISQQLSASANGSIYHITVPNPFKPSVPSLICNALWFVSLGFSLACALIATLVQQWARDFLHKADMRSAPIIRARIFSYLYYGLKRFQMHTVVEVIPLLLHTSLLLFFAGLVAFLIPVNVAMSAIAAAILALVGAAYSVLTLLPLRYLDCPYQTPLSGTFWHILHAFKKIWYRWRTPAPETVLESHPEAAGLQLTEESMVDAMSRTAMDSTDQRLERDSKALVWTVKSLTDNVELEPFVEALPDLLWGPTGRRTSYDHHIQYLLRHSDVRLLDRIGGLLISCDAGILAPNATQRRQITCLKALWGLASLAIQWSIPLDFSAFTGSAFFRDRPPFSDSIPLESAFFSFMDRPPFGNSFDHPEKLVTAPYIASARALMAWSTFLAVKGRLKELQDRLLACEHDAAKSIEDSQELEEIAKSFRHIVLRLSAFGILPWKSDCSSNLVDLRLQIEEYLSDNTVGQICLNFFSESGCCQESPPYRFDDSYALLPRSHMLPPSHRNWVGRAIHICVSAHVERLHSNSTPAEIRWIKDTLSELFSFWQPTGCIPRGIIVCLNALRSVWFLAEIFRANEPLQAHLWNCFPKTLLEGAAEPNLLMLSPGLPPLPREDLFTALWRLTYLSLGYQNLNPDILPLDFEPILKVVSNAASRFAHISASVIALLKLRILQTASSSDIHYLSEARVALAAEYLECCTSDVLPYSAVQTWNAIASHNVSTKPIPTSLQLRQAESIHAIFVTTDTDTHFLQAIVNSWCWHIYAEGQVTQEEVRLHHKQPRRHGWPWLDDTVARQQITQALTVYKTKLTASGDSPKVLDRVKRILDGFDSWHCEAERSRAQDEDDVCGDDGLQRRGPDSALEVTNSRITADAPAGVL